MQTSIKKVELSKAELSKVDIWKSRLRVRKPTAGLA